MMTLDVQRQFLEQHAEKLGLKLIGVVNPKPDESSLSQFDAWLDEGKHAGMGYLERQRALRRDPNKILAEAKTAIVFGLPYDQRDSLKTLSEGPLIAQYARFRDYHSLMRRAGEELAEKIREVLCSPNDFAYRVVVDSAPVMERALAVGSRRGFIGKNSCFIHPTAGSFLLLGEIFLNQCLEFDVPEPVGDERSDRGGCGSCTRCQVHCPTGALDKAHQVDARRCISYWTIEHRGVVPLEFWPHFAKYVFGCDICQLVCPYTKKSRREPGDLSSSLVRDHRRHDPAPDLFIWATLDQATYERVAGGTPLIRAKRVGLMRNALIAMCVTKDLRLEEALEHVRRCETDATLHQTIKQIETMTVIT